MQVKCAQMFVSHSLTISIHSPPIILIKLGTIQIRHLQWVGGGREGELAQTQTKSRKVSRQNKGRFHDCDKKREGRGQKSKNVADVMCGPLTIVNVAPPQLKIKHNALTLKFSRFLRVTDNLTQCHRPVHHVHEDVKFIENSKWWLHGFPESQNEGSC